MEQQYFRFETPQLWQVQNVQSMPVNVRDAPDTSARQLAQHVAGEVVKAVGKLGAWLHVKNDRQYLTGGDVWMLAYHSGYGAELLKPMSEAFPVAQALQTIQTTEMIPQIEYVPMQITTNQYMAVQPQVELIQMQAPPQIEYVQMQLPPQIEYFQMPVPDVIPQEFRQLSFQDVHPPELLPQTRPTTPSKERSSNIERRNAPEVLTRPTPPSKERSSNRERSKNGSERINEVFIEKVVEQEVPVTVEKIVVKQIPYPIEKYVERVEYTEVTVPIEKIIQVPVEKTIDNPVLVDVNKFVDVQAVRFVEVLVPKKQEKERASRQTEVPVESYLEVPVERIVDIVENVVEIPVERVVDTVVEVPVERIVERRVEVPVERIVEKIVYVDREPTQFVAEPVYETRRRLVQVPMMVMQEQEVEETFEIGRRTVPLNSQFMNNGAISFASPAMKNDRAGAVGVGLALTRGSTDSVTYVEGILPGFAAEKSGQIQIGDAIEAINGISVQGWTLDAIKNLTIGPEGSNVDLDLRRGGQYLSVTLTRQMPTMSSARSYLGDASVLIR